MLTPVLESEVFEYSKRMGMLKVYGIRGRSTLTPEELAKEAEEDLQRIPGAWQRR
jgi:hypothetical protein